MSTGSVHAKVTEDCTKVRLSEDATISGVNIRIEYIPLAGREGTIYFLRWAEQLRDWPNCPNPAKRWQRRFEVVSTPANVVQVVCSWPQVDNGEETT